MTTVQNLEVIARQKFKDIYGGIEKWNKPHNYYTLMIMWILAFMMGLNYGRSDREKV